MPSKNTPDLTPHTPDNRVRGVFSRIAGGYDLVNRLFSFGLDAYWRKLLARSVFKEKTAATGHILDLAAGTLEVSRVLAAAWPGARILAADFCLPMLEKGRRKLKAGSPVSAILADANQLPLPENSVDAVTLAWGLRNMRPREPVYDEALRVLKPGGRFCVLEFAGAEKPILFGLYNVYLKYLLPLGGWLFSRDKAAYDYLASSVREYPDAESLAWEMRKAGFSRVEYRQLSFGICTLHVAEKT